MLKNIRDVILVVLFLVGLVTIPIVAKYSHEASIIILLCCLCIFIYIAIWAYKESRDYKKQFDEFKATYYTLVRLKSQTKESDTLIQSYKKELLIRAERLMGHHPYDTMALEVLYYVKDY